MGKNDFSEEKACPIRRESLKKSWWEKSSENIPEKFETSIIFTAKYSEVIHVQVLKLVEQKVCKREIKLASLQKHS